MTETHYYQKIQVKYLDQILQLKKVYWSVTVTNIICSVLFVALGLIWKSYSMIAVSLVMILLNCFGALLLSTTGDNDGRRK